MEGEKFTMDSEGAYPVLFIPKVCTTLETNCELNENVFIHLNITSPDTEGNEISIYAGFCNIKIVKSNEIDIRYNSCNLLNEHPPVKLTEAKQISFPTLNDPQVWIEPVKSPYMYNGCDSSQLETYTIHEGNSNHIMVEQHSTYITQNVFNYNGAAIRYSPVQSSEEPKPIRKTNEIGQIEYNLREEDELECVNFLSQLSEEIINEHETKQRDEKRFIGLKTDNEALKQLMSTNSQCMSKQQKTILFLGHDKLSGQTIQNISINDPKMECTNIGEDSRGEVIEDQSLLNYPQSKKKYQCDKCKHIFGKLADFKQHMVVSHRMSNFDHITGSFQYICLECGKNIKTREKFEQHCMRHGDPDLECNKCHKVFASKFTLRNHRKIHNRKYTCKYCTRTYATAESLQTHWIKSHDIYTCDYCPYMCDKISQLYTHEESHRSFSDQSKHSRDSTLSESVFEDITDFSNSTNNTLQSENEQCTDFGRTQDISNKVFNFKTQKPKKKDKNNKTCEVCHKKFDRIGDLKRHLIEHVIRSTLAKNPVNKHGFINIRCEVCHEKVFYKIDKYKAHLREHAKLTLYKCTFCDKSFSDSSNFSKHKKIHGTTFFQCDLCQRKFNSKKMIARHIEYHDKNGPVTCHYCEKKFHFKSILNKHIKSAHTKEFGSKTKCTFCDNLFKSLKEKWDHEWLVHHVRKTVVDCLICGYRFRKYSELKKHCLDVHELIIPPAKNLLKMKSKSRSIRLCK